MAQYHATVESHSPAAETFGYLATFSNAAEWDPGVLSGEPLDAGPVRAGSRFRLILPVLGARMPLTYEVTRLVPDREVLLHAANAVLQSTDRIAVTGTPDGSAVSYDAEVRLRGPLRILDPLLRPGFRAVAQRAAAGLASALSQRPPGGAASPANSGPLPAAPPGRSRHRPARQSGQSQVWAPARRERCARGVRRRHGRNGSGRDLELMCSEP